MNDDSMRTAEADPATVWGLGYWSWAAVFVAAMIAAAAANVLDLVPDRLAIWLQLAPLILVVPMASAQMALFGKHGVSSAALTRYNRDMLLSLGALVVCIGGAAYLGRRFDPSGAAAFGLALLTVVPIVGIVWSVVRYLRDESDEFLRHKATGALLISLFFVLIVGGLWGSLQMFGMAPQVMNWWVLTAWGFGLGVGNLWQWTRGR